MQRAAEPVSILETRAFVSSCATPLLAPCALRPAPCALGDHTVSLTDAFQLGLSDLATDIVALGQEAGDRQIHAIAGLDLRNCAHGIGLSSQGERA